MIGYTVLFLVMILLAGLLGFGVVAGFAAMAAKALFLVFVALFVGSLLRRPRAE